MNELEFKPRGGEANVQAEFYFACKREGIPCFLEYRSWWNGVSGCRFDAVIHNNKNILAIIETKSIKPHRREKRIKTWAESKQKSKYSQFGLPVFFITCPADIPEVILKIQRLVKAPGQSF